MDHSGQTLNIFSRYAKEYNEKYMDQSAYADILMEFIQKIPERSRNVLDVGCGPGNVMRFVMDAEPELRIHGIDFSPEMIRLAGLNCPGAVLEVMDVRDANSIDGPFGGIICSFCIPYISHEEASSLIKELSGKLVNDGTLYLSILSGDPERSGIEKNSKGEEVCIYYHDTASLRDQLKQEKRSLAAKISAGPMRSYTC